MARTKVYEFRAAHFGDPAQDASRPARAQGAGDVRAEGVPRERCQGRGRALRHGDECHRHHARDPRGGGLRRSVRSRVAVDPARRAGPAPRCRGAGPGPCRRDDPAADHGHGDADPRRRRAARADRNRRRHVCRIPRRVAGTGRGAARRRGGQGVSRGLPLWRPGGGSAVGEHGAGGAAIPRAAADAGYRGRSAPGRGHAGVADSRYPGARRGGGAGPGRRGAGGAAEDPGRRCPDAAGRADGGADPVAAAAVAGHGAGGG